MTAAFWSAVGPEPKRNYRWVVRFSPVGMSSISYALKKVDKPKADVKEASHAYLNHKFYYPGRLEWSPISMTFAAISQPDATYVINEVLKQSGYGVPSNAGNSPDQLATIGKNKFRGALGNSIDIYQLDADGNTNELWQLFNPFFQKVEYGALSYEDENIVEITTTVRYDWAKLTVPTSEAGGAMDFGDFGRRPGTNGNTP